MSTQHLFVRRHKKVLGKKNIVASAPLRLLVFLKKPLYHYKDQRNEGACAHPRGIDLNRAYCRVPIVFGLEYSYSI